MPSAKDNENLVDQEPDLSPIPRRNAARARPRKTHIVSTPKLALATKNTPMRSNLPKYSPLPETRSNARKVVAAAAANKTRGVAKKTSAAPKSRAKKQQTPEKPKPAKDSDISIKTEDQPAPVEDCQEEVEAQEETPMETSPIKVKRARLVKAKPAKKTPEPKPKKAPTRRAPARGKKEKPKQEAEVAEDQQEQDEEPEMVEVPEAEESIEIQYDLFDFSKFKFSKVINDSVHAAHITLQGTYNNETAVIKLEKSPFVEEAIKKAVSHKSTSADRIFANDVYSSYMLNPSDASNELSKIKVTVVCPASESVLAKYSRSDCIFFSETPDSYTKIVEPFINNKLENDVGCNNWVYNILEGKSEVDRVILNDPDPDSGFIICPDLKWSGDEKQVKLLAICHRRDIKCLRDLNDKHLTLLKNIMTKGTKAVKDKFKKSSGQLRSFIHYQPSFYHFHVHFEMVDASDYTMTDRDNLLSNVINNITMNKDYYKKSTLTYPLKLSSPLYQDLKKAKRV